MSDQLRAVIFDMDGVISDTQPIHSAVDSQIFAEHGIVIDPHEITKRFSGMSNRDIYHAVFAGHKGKRPNMEEFVSMKRARVFTAAKGNVKPIPGIIELINQLRTGGIVCAIASASQKPFIDLVLSELGLHGHFQAIASATEVEHGKPDPRVFLLAAQRLGVEPSRCAVIEDGISGMIAAHRAGMRCVGLVPICDPETYPADLLVTSFAELSITALNDLWSG